MLQIIACGCTKQKFCEARVGFYTEQKFYPQIKVFVALALDTQCSRTGFEMFRSTLPANPYFRKEAATTIARQNDLI